MFDFLTSNVSSLVSKVDSHNVLDGVICDMPLTFVTKKEVSLECCGGPVRTFEYYKIYES